MDIVKINPIRYMGIDEDYIDSLSSLEKKKIKESGYLEEFRIMKQAFDDHIKYNGIHYKELVDDYKKILKEVSEVLKYQSIGDPVMMVTILANLVWDGYLSNKSEFRYSSNLADNEELEALYGINVIYGKGCCRNIAMIFNDLLRMCGFESYMIGVKISSFSASAFEIEAARKDENNNVLNNINMESFQTCGGYEMNHANIIFKYNNSYVIFDPTNIRFYSLKQYFGFEIYGDSSLILQPSTLALFNGYSYSDVKEKCKIFNENNRVFIRDLVNSFDRGMENFDKEYLVYRDLHHGTVSTMKKMNDYKDKILLKR